MLSTSFKPCDRRHRRIRSGVVAVAGAVALVMALGYTAAPMAGAMPMPQGGTGAHIAAPHLLKPRTPHAPRAVIPGPLIDHGGGVETAPEVFVVFWGWTADPSGEQPYITQFLSSVGGSSWLATVNQYDGGGSNITFGGTFSDPTPIPASPSDAQIQQEALNAANHFGTDNSANVQIVVATPTGHSTPGFGTQFCAYHGDVAADPNITYTNMGSTPRATRSATSARSSTWRTSPHRRARSRCSRCGATTPTTACCPRDPSAAAGHTRLPPTIH